MNLNDVKILQMWHLYSDPLSQYFVEALFGVMTPASLQRYISFGFPDL